jgi:3-hydroxybutyryl-CoA dehydrogenase
VAASFAKAEQRGTLAVPAVQVLSRLTLTTEAAQLSGYALVIEAVPESEALKRRVLAIAQEVAPEAYLATNTSSLSIDGLAAELPRRDGFIGLHFFNPVPASSMAEVVVGARTSSGLVALA